MALGGAADYIHQVEGTPRPADQCQDHYRVRKQRAPGPGEEYELRQADRPAYRGARLQAGAGIVGPGKLEDVFGGGICSLDNAVQRAFEGGLELLERRPFHLQSPTSPRVGTRP